MLGLFVGLLGLVVITIISIGSLDKSTEPVEIKDNTVITLYLPSAINDRSEEDELTKLLQILSKDNSLGLNQITETFERAREDKKIKGIYLNPGMFSGGYGFAREIRNSILEFKESGKFIFSYSENYTEQGYYIASACDQVYLNPNGICEVNGLSSGVMMFKGLLDKLGFQFQIFKAGKFKGAVEPFVKEQLSDENKYQIRAYLNSLQKTQFHEISESRRIDLNELTVFSANNDGYEAIKLKESGLVDDLVYWDEFEKYIEEKVKLPHWVSAKNYLISDDENYTYAEKRIAVLYLEGDIVPGPGVDENKIGSNDVVKQLRKIRKDEKIKALILRINSPGGSSAASDIIAREVAITKKKMPVYSSYGNVAASGGYYISCLSDKIYASPNTITGSIGVFALIPNTQELFSKKLGLKYESIKTMENADLWRPDQPLSDFQAAKIQGMINKVYDDFTAIVAKGRKITQDSVKNLAEGRVYSGIEAVRVGLVDSLGGLKETIAFAKKQLGEGPYRIVKYPKVESPIESLFQKLNSDSPLSSTFNKQAYVDDFITAYDLIERHRGPQLRLPWYTSIR